MVGFYGFHVGRYIYIYRQQGVVFVTVLGCPVVGSAGIKGDRISGL